MIEKKFPVVYKKATLRDVSEPQAVVRNRSEVEEMVANVLRTILNGTMQTLSECEVAIEPGDRTTVFRLSVAKTDFGRLLGGKGKHIEALRTVVSSLCASNGFRGVVQVKDEDRFF